MSCGRGSMIRPRRERLLWLILLLCWLAAIETIRGDCGGLSFDVFLFFEFQCFWLAYLFMFSEMLQYLEIQDDDDSAEMSVERTAPEKTAKSLTSCL